MEVTNVEVRTGYQKGKLLGFANVTFDDIMMCKNWKIWNNDDGTIGVSFPTEKTIIKDENGNDKTSWFPVTLIKVAKEGEDCGPGDTLMESVRQAVENKYRQIQTKSNNKKGYTQSDKQQTQQVGEPPSDDIPF